MTGAMRHLLVTNDFPPKVGGIQNLLWEWWRRLPPEDFVVLTTPYAGAAEFDAAQPFRVERTREPILLPHPRLISRINALAAEIGAERVVLDPAIPLGLVGPSLHVPYVVLVHGTEVTVPGRLPLSRSAMSMVLRGATHVVASGQYVAHEARRAARRELPLTVVTPGVDVRRFVPLSPGERRDARAAWGFADDDEVVVGVSRLVRRKGFDVLIEAAAILATSRPRLRVAIAGAGRDGPRLARLIAWHRAPVRMVGRVPNEVLPRFYGCADLSAMVCRSRIGGLEQEGFGIVFAESASCGVPQIAGASGGAAEAVADGITGVVLPDPRDARALAETIANLLDDDARRADMGVASRRRALDEFDYDLLSVRLREAIAS